MKRFANSMQDVLRVKRDYQQWVRAQSALIRRGLITMHPDGRDQHPSLFLLP
jgi:predicted transcriptional regulator